MLNKIRYILSRRDKFIVLALLAMIVFGSFLEMGAVAVFEPFTQMLTGSGKYTNNVFVQILQKIFGVDDYKEFLIVLAIFIMIIYVAKDLYTIWEKSLIYRFAYSMQRRKSTELLKAYMKEPYTFHLNKNVSVLQRSLQVDTERFSNGILHAMELIAEIFVCIALFVYLMVVSKSLTIIVGFLLVICVGAFYAISKKYSVKWGVEAQQYNAKVYQWMNQSIGGVKELKVLNRENNYINEYDKQLAKYVRVLRYQRIIGVVPKYIIEMVSMIGMLLAIVFKLRYGNSSVVEDYMSQIAIFGVAALRLIPSVGRINEHLVAVMGSLPSIDLIYNDIREVENIPDSSSIRDENWKFKDTVHVDDVTFRYPDGDVDVISHAKFDIKKGQTIAFIGSSGAGKSTMVDILLGLLKPTGGHIIADQLDVFENLPTWQKEIGYIPQTIYLSDDSIRNNVAFGIAPKDIDDEKVIDALKKAQLYDYVQGLPDGLDAFVGDRGVRISGGQRQRIGIARALYHNPEVLVLDEATSALDTETESAVMEAIDSLKGQKTIIIIAHRLSTIKNADIVYEVGNGLVTKINYEL